MNEFQGFRILESGLKWWVAVVSCIFEILIFALVYWKLVFPGLFAPAHILQNSTNSLQKKTMVPLAAEVQPYKEQIFYGFCAKL